MILYKGQIRDTSEQDELIAKLGDDISCTIRDGKKISPDDVITACDTLVRRVREGKFNDIIEPFLRSFNVDMGYFDKLCDMFTREGLTLKLKTELPDEDGTVDGKFRRRRYPLGVLLHIAAGNFDVLPAYSVVEGLLAGNINILKLPMGDSGLSVRLLSEMIEISPVLSEFIYVFDVPSTETASIVKLAGLSDGIAVWGGEAAVSAVRKMSNVNTKIIEWGHKLSFAYCTQDCSDDDLMDLAKSVCITNQTLCSSCQGIFLDTESDEELDLFAERFMEILKKANAACTPADYGMRAKNAINIYNERLEQHQTKNLILSEDQVSVIAKRDSDLELSYMYRNVWVKKLPSDKIHTLHRYKGYLQTAAVLTSDDGMREILCGILADAGVVRITHAGTMSRMASGEAHDGTYALREYSRIVETDIF